MKHIKITNIILLILLTFFSNTLYSQDNIIQICTVRNEREEGFIELKELSGKIMAYDPRYKIHKEALLWSCKNLGIFNDENPIPNFIFVYNSMSDLDKLKIAKKLVSGDIAALLIIGDIRPDIVSIIWGEICELHNSDRNKFLAISFIIIPEEVVKKMNEYMRSRWYKSYEIPSYEYFTYRGINTARIIASSPIADSRASLRGIITDDEGVAIPGVTIKVTGGDLKREINTFTDENGTYMISMLTPGKYNIRAEFPGFKTSVFENILFKKGDTKKVDLVMKLGAMEEEITITGSIPIVDKPTTGPSQISKSHIPEGLELSLIPGIDDENKIRILFTGGRYITNLLELEVKVADISVSGNLSLNLPTKQFIPFATIGLGISWDGKFIGNIGGGIKIRLTDKLNIRTEYLYFRNSDIRTHVIFGGISYFF